MKRLWRVPWFQLLVVVIATLAVYAVTILLTLPEKPTFYDNSVFTAEMMSRLYDQMKPSPTELDYWTRQGRVGLALILAIVTLLVGLTWVIATAVSRRPEDVSRELEPRG